MMSVGYGDIKGWTIYERLLLIFILIESLYVVAGIRSSVLNLLRINKLRDILTNTKFQVEDYVHRVDKTIKNKKIPTVFYEKIGEYVLQRLAYS